MLTLILYIVYIAVYPRRFTMIGFVTTMMMMGWLLGAMIYVLLRRFGTPPLGGNDIQCQHITIISVIIASIGIIVCVVTYIGADSDITEDVADAVDTWDDDKEEDDKLSDDVSDDDEDADPDSWAWRKKYCDSLPVGERRKRSCQNDNYMVDRETFGMSWRGKPEIANEIFSSCDKDNNGWITPNEEPCSLPSKSTKIEGDGYDDKNTSGCQLPGDGEHDMDKFMDCMNKRG